MKKIFTTDTITFSAYDNEIAEKIQNDIKAGLGYFQLLTKYPGYDSLIDFYRDRS